jgi:hypothetical protein
VRRLVPVAVVAASVLAALTAWDWAERRAPEGTRWVSVGKVMKTIDSGRLMARSEAVRIGGSRWLHVERGYVRFAEGDEVMIAERPDGTRQLCKVARKACTFIQRDCGRAYADDLPANCRAVQLPVGREFFGNWLSPFVPHL